MEQRLLEPSSDAFDRQINHLVAQGDDRALLDLLAAIPTTVKAMCADPEERFDIPIPVTNAGALAAVALRRDKPGVVTAALDNLLEAYRLGPVDTDTGSVDDLRLWEQTAAVLWALGAVATHLEQWAVVRDIVDRQPVDGGFYTTWLRHGQVMSARGALVPEDDNVLNLCADLLARNPSFGLVASPNPERERLFCVFDQLALLVVASLPNSGGLYAFYPSYAKFPVAHIEPIVVALRDQGPLRAAIFPSDDETLRAVLRDVNELALLQAAQQRYRGRSWAYSGFQDARTWTFIREGQRFEDWQV
jgi:hypothetical protein